MPKPKKQNDSESKCAHCKISFELPVSPDEPAPEAAGECPDCSQLLCAHCLAEIKEHWQQEHANMKAMLASVVKTPEGAGSPPSLGAPSDPKEIRPLTPQERVRLIVLHILLREYRDEQRARLSKASEPDNASTLLPDLLVLALDIMHVPIVARPEASWRSAPIEWWNELCTSEIVNPENPVPFLLNYIERVQAHVRAAAICQDPLSCSGNW